MSRTIPRAYVTAAWSKNRVMPRMKQESTVRSL